MFAAPMTAITPSRQPTPFESDDPTAVRTVDTPSQMVLLLAQDFMVAAAERQRGVRVVGRRRGMGAAARRPSMSDLLTTNVSYQFAGLLRRLVYPSTSAEPVPVVITGGSSRGTPPSRPCR